MAVFTQSEVADIVGMSRGLLKNWTIGRPLKIIPSERPARGPGSPNLYNRQDVYLVALAHELNKAGLALDRIDEVLTYLKSNLSKTSPTGAPDLRDATWLSIELQGQHLTANIFLAEQGAPNPHFFTVQTQAIEQVVFVKYLVKVRTLVDTIDKSIAQHEESMQQ